MSISLLKTTPAPLPSLALIVEDVNTPMKNSVARRLPTNGAVRYKRDSRENDHEQMKRANARVGFMQALVNGNKNSCRAVFARPIETAMEDARVSGWWNAALTSTSNVKKKAPNASSKNPDPNVEPKRRRGVPSTSRLPTESGITKKTKHTPRSVPTSCAPISENVFARTACFLRGHRVPLVEDSVNARAVAMAGLKK